MIAFLIVPAIPVSLEKMARKDWYLRTNVEIKKKETILCYRYMAIPEERTGQSKRGYSAVCQR